MKITCLNYKKNRVILYMSHEERQYKKFSNFQIFLTAVYCPILMTVIALNLSWKKVYKISVQYM